VVFLFWEQTEKEYTHQPISSVLPAMALHANHSKRFRQWFHNASALLKSSGYTYFS